MSDIGETFAAQRSYKWVVKNSSAAERKAKLARLKQAILDSADAIAQALRADLRKPAAEIAGEIGSVGNDINDAVEHLDEWMRPIELPPNPAFQGARSRIVYEARGTCLIFGPWNFPFQLLFEPLVPAIAAGNCVVLKPNELARQTSRVSAQIVRQVFDTREIAVFEGGIDLANRLLELPFDHIFFTGSPSVGRQVMAAAAKHLSSVTLELGGKCPVVLDSTTDIVAAAGTIAAARCYNSGQVCLCPDAAWVPQKRRDEFVDALHAAVDSMLYHGGELDKAAFGRMVNERNFDRVKSYLDDALQRGAKVAFGGKCEREDLTIHPTVLLDVPAEARVMKEEIFGPILPVLTYGVPEEVYAAIQRRGKPLAMYIYSNDRQLVASILDNTSSGGATVNGWAMHWFDPRLPFGGVNESGIGRYHGIHGFHELSHERSVFIQG